MANKWNLALNLKGVTPMDPTSFSLPTGVYEVQIAETDSVASKDPSKPNNINVECVVQGGEHKGNSVRVTMGTDTLKKGVIRHWRALLESIGAPSAALESEGLTIGPETLAGKKAYLYIVAKNPDDKEGYDQRNFVTEGMANKIRASLGTVGAPANGAAPAAATTPATAQPAAGAGAMRF